MTKVDIISGFLGAGKTTLIKKLLKEVYANQQVVLIENEFGEIGIDGGFLKEAGINITEMNSGCICCSLVGDFGKALKEVTEKYHPDRIIIEPSGVGKLSDVRKAVEDAAEDAHLEVNSLITVANASKIKMYMRTFGEFYNNQVENAGAIILSRTQNLTEEKQMEAAALVREKNPNAVIITTPWDDLTGQQILDAIEGTHSLAKELMEEHEHEHHHHDGECGCGCGHDHEHEHHHDGECGCGHDHDHEEHEHHHDHDHEHHHDGECGCGHHHDHEEHEHHHDHEHEHGEDCGCGEHATMMLQLDDGSELKCTVLGIFDVEEIEGKEYIALLREDNDEVLIYEYSEDENEEPILANIESDDDYDKVESAFMALLDVDEEDIEELEDELLDELDKE